MKRSILATGLSLFSFTSAMAQVQVQVQQQVEVQQILVPVQADIQVNQGVPMNPGKDQTHKEFKPTDGSSPDPKSLEIPADVLQRSRSLVQQLGSSSFREREAASRELAKLGRLPLSVLKESFKTETNLDVILRIEHLLPEAESLDMTARVSCFLKDIEGKYEHKLPGWNKFRTIVGDDRNSRELFTEVLKNKVYHSLILATDMPPNDLGQLLNTHYFELQNSINRGFRRSTNNQLQTSEIAVLLFLESTYSDKSMSLNYNFGYSISNYLYSGEIQAAMTNRGNSKYASIIRKLMARWMDTRETSMGAQMAMNFAMQWNVGDLAKYTGRVLEGETIQGNWWIKTNALAIIGQKSLKQCVPQIMKMFDDSTIIQAQQPVQNANVQNIHMQDYALGTAIRLTGQNPKDYAMNELNSGINNRWQHNNYFFVDDKTTKAEDKRKAAIKKFNDWYAENNKQEPKKDEPKKEDTRKVEPKKDELKNDDLQNVLPRVPNPRN